MRILILSCAMSEVDVNSGNDEHFPRLAEISWIVMNEKFKITQIEKSHYIYPDENFKRVSPKAKAINGLSIDLLREKGEKLEDILEKFYSELIQADVLVGANVWAMKKILSWEIDRYDKEKKINSVFLSTRQIDILDVARPLVKAKYSDLKSGIKRPTLKQTVKKLTNEDIPDNTYNEDTINNVFKCFVILSKIGMISLTDK